MTSDDELFEELRRTLSPPHREPPAESVAALHARVTERFRRKAWWRHKIAIGAATFSLIAGTPAAAFALGGAPLPDPLRTALHDIGLPVDSVPVADAKSAEVRLQSALDGHDQGTVAKAAADLQARLSGLDEGDRTGLGRHAQDLLQRAADETTSTPPAPSESISDDTSGDRTTATTAPTGGPSGGAPDGGPGPSSGSAGQPSGFGGGPGPSGGEQETTTTVSGRSPSTGDAGGAPSGTTTTTSVPQSTTTTNPSGGGGGGSGSGSGGGPGGDGGTTTTTTQH